ncbi:glycoside hydrolase family 9 protein [Cohnella abietis]|uniref:Uncharacterized protein n=1 Tax=Cohnella abietis TaxID=2507935 RepID=A0A3T1D3J0_9BACL|nr:glycoside hydrolase family 9 protein [Cohnella abietis]BBI32680.1 hypothetical protein KCTCHS21_20790 [Cohnella abietis]
MRIMRLSKLGVALLLCFSVICYLPAKRTEAAVVGVQSVISQAGYGAGDQKNGFVVSDHKLTDLSFQILNGTTTAYSGTLKYEGFFWNNFVYQADFSSLAATGTAFKLSSNGSTSFAFPIQTNMWSDYLDEMTAFYRIQRAGVATVDVLPPGYTNTTPSAKLFHSAGHLDDAVSSDGTQHYDLSGGWYDAGDYGQYGGNQWVGGEIALAYLRNSSSPLVQYDRDNNGIPDLLDEARWGAEYGIKYVDALGGAFYNINNNAGFVHPEKSTNNIPGDSDDRELGRLSVGGSAKAAGMMAATARAFQQAGLDPAFVSSAESHAITAYDYAYNNQDKDQGSYETIGQISNALLWAEVELYLLTGDSTYNQRATDRINTLEITDVTSTNYWDMRPMALVEFYPVADTATKTHIHKLLKSSVDYFLSSSEDTPYGVLNEFSGFGVNEPHVSYLGDLMRYYELFGDPSVLRAVKKGMYWVFGNNPWNTSWVSGIGSNTVKFVHTRLDEESYSNTNQGIVVPGAMVSGPNITDTKDNRSESPWYVDRPLWQDDLGQWRYNEYSISIQVGLLYTITALTNYNENPSGGTTPTKLQITSPKIGDYVTGVVKVFAEPESAISDVTLNGLNMTSNNGTYTGTIDVSYQKPFTKKLVRVKGTDSLGYDTYANTHFTVAPPLPSPSTPLLYDNFNTEGTFGSKKLDWVNWYNQNGGVATFERKKIDGRDVGIFKHTASSTSSQAKIQSWHDIVDWSGYRYMQVTVKNPDSPNLRVRFEIEDGVRAYGVSEGNLTLSNEWTTLLFDLNKFPLLDKKNVNLVLWMSETDGGTGSFYIDEIIAVNQASGSAPTITNTALSATTGTPATPFVFTSTYQDVDNEKPFAVQVVIDGVIHNMQEMDSSDVTYTDGKDYSYTTKLPLGEHSYYFMTTDSTSDVVQTSTQNGPIVSPPTITKSRYEAELATLSGGANVNSNHTGYSGTGFVDHYASVGANTLWTVNASSGKQDLLIKYANGSAGGPKTASLYVNGTKTSTISFPNVGGWSTWGSVKLPVTLNDGTNTIGIKYDTGDSGNINLDYIELNSPFLDTEAPTVPTNLRLVAKTDTTVSLTWAASVDNVDVMGYDIYRDGTTLCGTSTVTAFTCTGLAPSTAYSFTVKARDAVPNISSSSRALNVTTNSARYEAELATLSGGARVNTDHTGYSGTGFVDHFGSVGASALWTVTTPSGTHSLLIRYANGTGSSKTATLYVNGVKIKVLSFANSSNWNTWATITEPVVLNSGSNTIEIKYDSGNSGNINLDYIEFAP